MCFYMVYCTAVSLRFVLYVEVAVNGMFGAGQGGMINPPDPDRHCSLSLSEIAVFDREVYDLIMDLTILYDMTKVPPAASICMKNIYFQWFCSRRNVFCKALEDLTVFFSPQVCDYTCFSSTYLVSLQEHMRLSTLPTRLSPPVILLTNPPSKGKSHCSLTLLWWQLV